MGLFSSGPSAEVAELLDGAIHDSVTAERLTELDSSGLTNNNGATLYDQPLIEYLEPDEQPHAILFPATKDIEVVAEESDAKTTIPGDPLYCFTDRRLVLVIGRENDADAAVSVAYDEMDETLVKAARLKHRVSITIRSDSVIDQLLELGSSGGESAAGPHRVDLFVTNSFSESDIDAFRNFIDDATHAGGVTDEQLELSESDYYDRIREFLTAEETPHHILRGKTLEVKQGGDEETKRGKSVFTVVTDDRVLFVITQKLSGTDTRSVEYSSIDGVNFEKGVITKELQIRAGAATYEAHILDGEEGQAAIETIRELRNERQESGTGPTTDPDPTEQLKNLTELHEQGVLTDEEFAEKKQELLERI